MANWVYYENYQIPIFTVGIVLLWTVVIIRFWIFKQTFCGWRSYRGAATILITATAALCTIYFGVMLAIYFVNQAMLKVRKLPREGEKMGTNPKFPWRDPINYSDAEVKEYIQHVCLLIRVRPRVRACPPKTSLPNPLPLAHLRQPHPPHHRALPHKILLLRPLPRNSIRTHPPMAPLPPTHNPRDHRRPSSLHLGHRKRHVEPATTARTNASTNP